MSRQRLALYLVAAAALPALGVCVLLGPSEIGLPDYRTATGQAVLLLRLTRVAAGFLVGASLSCAGVILQALLRNPLAEPYVLGVSSGAGLGAAIAILSGLAASSMLVLPVTAFLFASLTLGLVYGLARRTAGTSVYGLILSGVIVSSVCSSVLMFLVSVAPIEGLHSVMWWMLGDLQIASAGLLGAVALFSGAAMLAAWALAPEWNALTLGREMAHHIGIRTRLAYGLGLVLATLMAASAVAIAGLIGFVGLIVPHVMRNVVGPDHRRLIPASILSGGVFLALCDAVARTLLHGVEIPVGVVTALLGGPFFMLLLRRKHREGWLE